MCQEIQGASAESYAETTRWMASNPTKLHTLL